MFIVIEMADVELIGTHLYHTRKAADIGFDQIAYENKVQECGPEDMKHEAAGTVRLAGDDAYSIQMIEDNPLDKAPPVNLVVEMMGGAVIDVSADAPISYEVNDPDV